MITKAFLSILIGLQLALFTHNAVMAAEEPTPWYQVEIILFAYRDADMTRETWPDDPGSPDLKKVAEILQSDELAPANGFIEQAVASLTPGIAKLVPRPYTLLTADQLTLNKEALAIKRSSARILLAHMGWIQPVQSLDKAPVILIRSGKEYTLEKAMFPQTSAAQNKPGTPAVTPAAPPTGNPPEGSDNTESQPQSPPVIPVTLPSTGVDPYIIRSVHEVEGSLRVSVSRYLHVHTDLMFYRPETSTNPVNPGNAVTMLKAFRFQDHRRMRSKELHYIDNPAFGLLIQITPYEMPKIETGAETKQP